MDQDTNEWKAFPSLEGATGWHNAAIDGGRPARTVVLVDFWTYTCSNWLRSLPYVRAWADKYKNQGLVVIGVHTPEFGFERDIANVRRAVKDLRVEFACGPRRTTTATSAPGTSRLPAGGSRTASTPATSTWSWDRLDRSAHVPRGQRW